MVEFFSLKVDKERGNNHYCDPRNGEELFKLNEDIYGIIDHKDHDLDLKFIAYIRRCCEPRSGYSLRSYLWHDYLHKELTKFVDIESLDAYVNRFCDCMKEEYGFWTLGNKELDDACFEYCDALRKRWNKLMRMVEIINCDEEEE